MTGHIARQAKPPRHTMTRSPAATMPQLGDQPRRARVPLRGLRLVVRWRAADGGHHPGVHQALAVPGRHAGRLHREPAPVQRREQEVAAAVAGENPAGTVPAVGRGGQADDQQAGPLRSPAGDGAAPVTLVAERAAAGLRHLLAPSDQPGAGPADRLPRGELAEGGRAARQLRDLRGAVRDGRIRARRIARPSARAIGRSGELLMRAHVTLSGAGRRPATRRSRRGCRARSPAPR